MKPKRVKHCNLCKNDYSVDSEGEFSGTCWCKCHAAIRQEKRGKA